MILCVRDLVGGGTAEIIGRVGEGDLAAVLARLSRLADLLGVVDASWRLSHVLRNMLVTIDDT